jgi:hypothetical protein
MYEVKMRAEVNASHLLFLLFGSLISYGFFGHRVLNGIATNHPNALGNLFAIRVHCSDWYTQSRIHESLREVEPVKGEVRQVLARLDQMEREL